MVKRIGALIAFLCSLGAFAQETFPVNGTHHEKHTIFYFTNATVHIDYQTTLEKGDLIVQDGKIIAVAEELEKPKGAVKYDLAGKHVYPSFIDPFSNYGMPNVKAGNQPATPQIESKIRKAYGWNQAIKSEKRAVELFEVAPKKAKALRGVGFGAVITHLQDGIVRGTSAGVLLGDGKSNEMVLNGNTSAHYSFKKGSSTQYYPSSLMGAIALLRQTYYDAVWYKNTSNIDEHNVTLEKFNTIQALPQIFSVTDVHSALRADRVGDEFGVQYIIKGAGDEYKMIGEIEKTGAAFIVPVNFPKAYDIHDPFDAMVVGLNNMKHWELAPSNPGVLEKNQIPFAFTADGLKDKKDYLENIKKAIKNGLSEEYALKAMTYNPAQLMGLENAIGVIDQGRVANFIITSGNIFKKGTVQENWVNGKRYIVENPPRTDIKGNYSLNIAGDSYTMEISGTDKQIKTVIKKDTTILKSNAYVQDNLISINLLEDNENMISLSGKINYRSGILDGRGQLSTGEWVKWGAIKQRKKTKKDKEEIALAKDSIVGAVWFPNMAYGFDSLPRQETVLIKNATIWTNEEEGILENSAVLIKEGKIVAVGKDFEEPEGVKIIDAKGKHVTAGIIDEHSHIAISRGVNECTHAVTSEVRIGDVVKSDDVNIYRQLAGGVTAAQLLHGSCNPVGGQSALIKLRWGRSPEEMKIESADEYIKFALGENVKRSNFGPTHKQRFPQTRMGVEQVYYDAFMRALEYEEEWKSYFQAYEQAKKKEKENIIPPRKQLELDALVQILNQKRFISCHSYQQSEINMLMHVADSLGFTVNTFTHILEGYKVAEKMKEHGAGGSTFSDWWAYKYEVNDAIPYNGAIMHEQGIVTAFNSDDPEMGRRLNQEAAKAIKYGGVSEEDALKFITLNPAKLLHLDHRMGSIKEGKDADLVIWSEHPLSIYAKAEQTYVDGICYYDSARDLELRKRNQKELMRIMKKMMESKMKGAPTQKVVKQEDKTYHCDTVDDAY